ncbi:hypothetical protein KUTeg_021938 [Tegillarca granosa]|uniref:Integrase catalytic domain-containing protein n=1 Tax=Tegillarca granosa TaxID=220873 RepID=A0ABQ9E7S6_TEGGR|nr:hypothetical protein KUTeg_021938 [Tegillarca granosa]
MERHQVDLVDLSSISVTLENVSYRNVLSVKDVFSRFLWLRAIPNKNSDTVANELYKIYIKFRQPKILQSDQGSEFKGSVIKLCSELNTKLIYSSSGHPQSQGKSERSHRTWKEKLQRDILLTKTRRDCDWVTGLPALQRIYNEGWHTVYSNDAI